MIAIQRSSLNKRLRKVSSYFYIFLYCYVLIMIRCKQKTVKNAARLVNQLKKKEYLLSISEMKNILKNQSKEELIKLVIDSYKAVPQLKEYITIRYAKQDEIEQIAEAYKNKIFNVFFPKNINAPFKISNAKKAISDKLCYRFG